MSHPWMEGHPQTYRAILISVLKGPLETLGAIRRHVIVLSAVLESDGGVVAGLG
ncbi:MAG TPA: hypothetical protein VF326_07500 [Anaerolineaceae bacterium]